MTSPVKEIRNTDVIGVVCHDAGGAELVSDWLLEQGSTFHACLAGPAVKIFRNKFNECQNKNLEDVFYQSDWVLCGSSWQSDLEKRAVKRAHELGLFVVVCLDHWANYEDRFTAEEVLILPSEIWVGDKDAFKLAVEKFPTTSIRQINNPYLQRVRNEIEAIQKNSYKIDIDVLYVCEPVREHARIKYGDEHFLGYTEESALQFFFQNLHRLSSGRTTVMIRPHPSDPCDKYDWAKAYNTALRVVSVGGNDSLISEVMRSKIVVGCESMAMVVAIMAGKEVYSSIPSGGRDCVLPHQEIKKLKDI